MAVADVYVLCRFHFALANCCVGFLRSDLDNSSEHTHMQAACSL